MTAPDRPAATEAQVRMNERVLLELEQCYGEGEDTDWPYLTDLASLIVSIVERESARSVGEVAAAEQLIDTLQLRNKILARSRAAFHRDNQALRRVLSDLIDAIDEDDDNVNEFNHALGAARERLTIEAPQVERESDRGVGEVAVLQAARRWYEATIWLPGSSTALELWRAVAGLVEAETPEPPPAPETPEETNP